MGQSVCLQMIFVIVACALTTVAAVCAETVGPNLIPNSSFESVVDGRPENISLVLQEGQPVIGVDDTIAHTGLNSVRIDCKGNERGAVGRRVTLTGGKVYRFSAWYRLSPGAKPDGFTIRLMFFKSLIGNSNAEKVIPTQDMLLTEGAFRLGLDNFIDANLDATENWQQVQMIMRVPESVVSVVFQAFNWRANGAVWVDDIYVEEMKLTIEDMGSIRSEARVAMIAAAEAKARARNESVVGKALLGLHTAHPRLLATADDFSRVRKQVETNTIVRSWAKTLQARAEMIMMEPKSEYTLANGFYLQAISRQVLYRVQTLAMVYQLTADRRYLDRIWQELEAAAGFPDWNPRHFLDTAEMTAAFALALDWCYDDWDGTQRSVLRQAIVEKGLKPGMLFYQGRPTGTDFVTAAHNWNFVCNSSLALGALAVLEEEHDLAIDILNAGLDSVQIALTKFAPDGAWGEGVMYWQYSIKFLVQHIAALQTALSTDFGLSQKTGLAQTGLFPIYMTAPTGRVFNFADSSSAPVQVPEMHWMATRYDRPDYAWWQNSMSASDDISPLNLLWRQPSPAPVDRPDLPLDAHFRDAEVASLRSAWGDTKALFLGFKAGDNSMNHGHLDIGTFVFEAQGVRWVEDLSNDNYRLPGYFDRNQRWLIYRCRAEGHNTLVINPNASPDQTTSAKAAIAQLVSTPGAVMVVADITPAYIQAGAAEVKRGVALLGNRTYALIQDEITLNQPGEIWWFMHTKADVQISTDGVNALLTQNGKRLLARLIAPNGIKFSVMPAQPLPTSPIVAGQDANVGINKLAIHIEGVVEAQFAVQLIPLSATDLMNNLAVAELIPTTEWRSVYIETQ